VGSGARSAARLSARGVACALTFAWLACGGASSSEPRPAQPLAGPSASSSPGAGSEAKPAPAPADDEAREAEQIAAIEFAVNQTAEAVHACYRRATAETLQVEGLVLLGVELGPEHRARRVDVIGDETGSDALTGCVVDVLRRFEFPPVFAAGDQIQLPLSFVAPDAQYAVDGDAVTVHEVGERVRARVLLDADNTANRAASMALLSLEPGAELALGQGESAELWYVLEGGGSIAGRGGRAVEVGAGAAVYAKAGERYAFTSTAPTRVLALYAPGGPEQWLENKALRGGANQLRTRRAPRVRSIAEAAALPIGGGGGEVSILFDAVATGDRAAYIGRLTARPGMRVPPHTHPTSTELLYVLQGEGVMTVAGNDYPVRARTAVQIPPGVEHAVRITSSEPLIAVQFYTPSGPEQRFK